MQFGKSKIYTAIIQAVSEIAPDKYEAKYLIDVIDEKPILNSIQLNFWQWIADYYLCTLGEVMAAALPSALKLASETRVILNLEHQFDRKELNDKEFLILDALELRHELTISEISKILAQKSVFPLLKSLLDKKIIFISEEITEKYQPKKIALIALNDFYNDKENLKQLFTVLEKAPKQADALLGFLKLKKQLEEVKKSAIIEETGVSSAAIKALIDKDIFIQSNKVVSRFTSIDDSIASNFILSDEQSTAFSEIKIAFEEKPLVLLPPS